MPLPIKDITRGHIKTAILSLDEGIDHHLGVSIRYDVLYEGERHPPKAVVGLAAKLAIGRELWPKDFSGGEGGAPCCRPLPGPRRRGRN
jgi:5-methylcytosine-specific restriction protein B